MNGDTDAARALLDRAADVPNFLEPEKEAMKRRLTHAMDAPTGALADAVARDAIAEAGTKPPMAPRDFVILTRLGRTEAAWTIAMHNPLPPAVFFQPQSRQVLLDPRFSVLARRAGLWDYWQQSGHWPDICRDPERRWQCGTGVKSVPAFEPR